MYDLPIKSMVSPWFVNFVTYDITLLVLSTLRCFPPEIRCHNLPRSIKQSSTQLVAKTSDYTSTVVKRRVYCLRTESMRSDYCIQRRSLRDRAFGCLTTGLAPGEIFEFNKKKYCLYRYFYRIPNSNLHKCSGRIVWIDLHTRFPVETRQKLWQSHCIYRCELHTDRSYARPSVFPNRISEQVFNIQRIGVNWMVNNRREAGASPAKLPQEFDL